MIKLRAHHGFTLIELIVAISIIALLVGLAMPFVAAMSNYSRVEAGINTVGVAVQAARAYVDRERTYITDPISEVGQFRGIAIIFSPAGEIRIAKHDPSAVDTSGDLLHLQLDGTIPDPHYGFRDIPNREYISIPDRVLIQGVIRDSISDAPVLLDPPFAIRYDENGHLIAGVDPSATVTANDRYVFYDGDHDGSIDINDDRPGGYTIDDFTWDFDDTPEFQRYKLPFEKLEAVSAIRITDTQTGDYQYITFSPYTGSPMRSK